LIFSNRDPDHASHGIRITRDLVEIVAILVAGLWAFYVFAYENRIKPSFTNPQVEFNATMSKGAARNGMVSVTLDTEIRNAGQVPAHVIGYAVWVYGRRISPLDRPQPVSNRTARLDLDGAYYRLSRRTPVFGHGYITALGDPATKADLRLQPGDDEKAQDVFFVPVHHFDLLEVYIHARFTKDDSRVIPTKLVIGRSGLPTFIGSHDYNFDFSNIISRISMM